MMRYKIKFNNKSYFEIEISQINLYLSNNFSTKLFISKSDFYTKNNIETIQFLCFIKPRKEKN